MIRRSFLLLSNLSMRAQPAAVASFVSDFGETFPICIDMNEHVPFPLPVRIPLKLSYIVLQKAFPRSAPHAPL